MYTEHARPGRAVLNSVTDNPRYGDETSFLAVEDVSTGRRQTDGDVALEPGRTYEASIFFRNDAAPGTRAGASTGTRARAQLPATVRGRERISGLLRSDSAAVPIVWKSLVLTTPADQPVAIRIVPHSSAMFTKATPAGLKLPAEELFSEAGTLVGCSTRNGIVTGEETCEGYVRFRFVADQPNFVVSQTVTPAGSDRHDSGLRFEAEARVTYTIQYRNTGTTQQDDVVLKEELPDGFRYVRGSTSIYLSTTGGKWKKTTDGVTRSGIDVGSYAPGADVYIRFTALLPDRNSLKCGLTSTTSTASAITPNGMKSTPSVLLVEKKCA
ncbi:hypothetical protein [Streptomyces sp. H51]|uniref:hypothetical protein n=1 Tax=Streptomyces sp. H51 TaxID=3111770 RepID=UPI002D76FF57|nr:hypothetical protein [Streptomyces sp. H51]